MTMNSFLEHALTRKPLQLVRRQAHLGDDGDSRYTPTPLVPISPCPGEDTGEGSGAAAGPAAAALDAAAPAAPPGREAPLRHMSLFDLVGASSCGVRRRRRVLVAAPTAGAGPAMPTQRRQGGCPPAT